MLKFDMSLEQEWKGFFLQSASGLAICGKPAMGNSAYKGDLNLRV